MTPKPFIGPHEYVFGIDDQTDIDGVREQLARDRCTRVYSVKVIRILTSMSFEEADSFIDGHPAWRYVRRR